MSEDLREILAETPLFNALEPSQLERLLTASSHRDAAAGEHLFLQGDACPGIIVVIEGAIRVYKLAPNGKEHLLRLVEGGDSFLEVAVIAGISCPASAQAQERTSYVTVDAEAFRSLLHADHGFCLKLLAGLSMRMRSMVGLLEDIVLRDATARIANHLLESADRATGAVRLSVSRKDLASHLNLTPETLSRALRRLSQEGLIEQQQGAITVVDRGGLGMAAEGFFPRM